MRIWQYPNTYELLQKETLILMFLKLLGGIKLQEGISLKKKTILIMTCLIYVWYEEGRDRDNFASGALSASVYHTQKS